MLKLRWPKAQLKTAEDAYELLQTAAKSRSSLFSENKEVKPWRAFYDNKLAELKSVKLKLKESHTGIIRNTNVFSGRVWAKQMK